MKKIIWEMWLTSSTLMRNKARLHGMRWKPPGKKFWKKEDNQTSTSLGMLFDLRSCADTCTENGCTWFSLKTFIYVANLVLNRLNVLSSLCVLIMYLPIHKYSMTNFKLLVHFGEHKTINFATGTLGEISVSFTWNSNTVCPKKL